MDYSANWHLYSNTKRIWCCIEQIHIGYLHFYLYCKAVEHFPEYSKFNNQIVFDNKYKMPCFLKMIILTNEYFMFITNTLFTHYISIK